MCDECHEMKHMCVYKRAITTCACMNTVLFYVNNMLIRGYMRVCM